MNALPVQSGGWRRLNPETKARIKQAIRTGAQARAIKAHAMQVEPHRRRSVRLHLWLPLSLLWVLLSPLAILAIPLIGAAGARRRINPFTAVAGVGALLFAMSGALIEIEAPSVSINIRLL